MMLIWCASAARLPGASCLLKPAAWNLGPRLLTVTQDAHDSHLVATSRYACQGARL